MLQHDGGQHAGDPVPGCLKVFDFWDRITPLLEIACIARKSGTRVWCCRSDFFTPGGMVWPGKPYKTIPAAGDYTPLAVASCVIAMPAPGVGLTDDGPGTPGAWRCRPCSWLHIWFYMVLGGAYLCSSMVEMITFDSFRAVFCHSSRRSSWCRYCLILFYFYVILNKWLPVSWGYAGQCSVIP